MPDTDSIIKLNKKINSSKNKFKAHSLKGTPSLKLVFPEQDKFNILKIEKNLLNHHLLMFPNIKLLNMNFRNNKLKTDFLCNILKEISKNEHILELDLDFANVPMLDEGSWVSLMYLFEMMP